MFGASERLKKMGAVLCIGASFHNLNLARQWLHSVLLDLVMVGTMLLVSLLRTRYSILTRHEEIDAAIALRPTGQTDNR